MTDFMMEAPATPATNHGGDEDQHLWPYLREMFSYVGVKDSSYRMKSLLYPKLLKYWHSKTPHPTSGNTLRESMYTTLKKDDATIRMGMDYIKQHMEEPSLQLGDATRSSSSDEDDFFSALQSSQARDSTKQLDGYLACSADHMTLLKSFPAVCKLSVKLNTPLPASAACERLFSIAGLVFSPRRARLNSRNFENQLLLKMNRTFFSFK
ncbi:uncharacterized protein LOC129108175 isoform X2 [Anoplopoma fimbria]|nr:uncharacterized protein LOC129108175 isoform X2 [Anoplopoma fimbria]